QRRALFVRRLQEISTAMTRPSAEQYTETLRQRVAQAHPELSDTAIGEVTVDYLRQALLLAPILGPGQQALAARGFLSLPINSLAANHQRLLLDWVAGSIAAGGDATGGYEVATALLSYPTARLEYRILYGDAWSEDLLLIRAGFPDRWTTAVLPAILTFLP